MSRRFFGLIIKRQLAMLMVERDTTIRALLGEELNDLFATVRARPQIVTQPQKGRFVIRFFG